MAMIQTEAWEPTTEKAKLLLEKLAEYRPPEFVSLVKRSLALRKAVQDKIAAEGWTEEQGGDWGREDAIQMATETKESGFNPLSVVLAAILIAEANENVDDTPNPNEQ